MRTNIHRLGIAINGELAATFATPPSMDIHDAAYHTVHRYKGGAHALAPRMQHRPNARGVMAPMSGSTLQHKVNTNCETHHLSLEEARDVMALTGDYAILHALSATLGHVALKIDLDCSGVTTERVMQMTKEFGDVLTHVGEATSKRGPRGARVTQKELRTIEQQALELMGAVNCLVGNLRALTRGEA